MVTYSQYSHIGGRISPVPPFAVDETVLTIPRASPPWSEELNLLKAVSDLLCPLLLQAVYQF